jgi:hypothetical protein
MRRWLVILVLGITVGAAVWAQVGRRRLSWADPGPHDKRRAPKWSAAVSCRTHKGWLALAGDLKPGRSPAAEKLLAAVYGLFLYAPGERLPIQLLARGSGAEDGQTLEGDLVLEGIHPELVRGAELWNAVQAVRRHGIRRIRGRILGSAGQAPQLQTYALPELEERLRLAGVQIEAAPARGTRTPGAEQRLGAWDSRPLYALLRRDLGLLSPLLPGPASLRSALKNLDPLDLDWVPASYPELTPLEVVGLLQKGLEHGPIGSELLAALQPLDLGRAGLAVRGAVTRGDRITELIGIAALRGHGEALVAVRVGENVPDAQLGERLEQSLPDPIEETEHPLSRPELSGPHSSSD